MVFLYCIFGFQYITNMIYIDQKKWVTYLNREKIKTGHHLGTKGTRRKYVPNIISYYKHVLNCRSCSWNVSYSEYSGSLDVLDDSVVCPVCKDGNIESANIYIMDDRLTTW